MENLSVLKMSKQIIAFTGAQGTGKTTLKDALVEYLKDHGYVVIHQYANVKEGIARDAKAQGFRINEKTDFITQYYLALKFMTCDIETRVMADNRKADYVILDRSILDVIPYSNVSANINQHESLIINNILTSHFKMLPMTLLFCQPLGFIKEDGIRSVDRKFQDIVHDEFSKLLQDNKHVYKVNADTVENRLDYVLKILEEK